ncbi:hypothetical protein LTS18_012895, partial [Coniosporium uncinatum]
VLEIVRLRKSSFGRLIKDFGIDKIVDILRNLLERRIFESELQAKVEFPELFRTSPARDVQRTRSENNAARTEAEALEEVEISEGKGSEADGADGEADVQPASEALEGIVQLAA